MKNTINLNEKSTWA